MGLEFEVEKCLLVSGTFTEDMKQESETFYDFDLTLVEAETLFHIHEEYKSTDKKEFP